MKKRIYIAGPMTGYDDLNFPAFHAAAATFRAIGIDVVNPAEINPAIEADWVDCMRADIQQLATCTGIYLLPGWEKSRGASLEHDIARTLGFDVALAPGALYIPLNETESVKAYIGRKLTVQESSHVV